MGQPDCHSGWSRSGLSGAAAGGGHPHPLSESFGYDQGKRRLSPWFRQQHTGICADGSLSGYGRSGAERINSISSAAEKTGKQSSVSRSFASQDYTLGLWFKKTCDDEEEIKTPFAIIKAAVIQLQQKIAK